jgi:predicted ABC-type transport system involved in lysophospholipase L1 biosynthesis ATPase subunit
MSDNTSQPVLSCRNLGKTFTQGSYKVEVLRGVDFDIYRGERIAIVGASGSSRPAHLLGGLDTPSAGAVTCWAAISHPVGDRRATCATRRSASSTSSTTCCPSFRHWTTWRCR